MRFKRYLGVALACAVAGFVVAPATVQSSSRQESPLAGQTHVIVDGDPSDWGPYPVIYADPVGDGKGEVDLTDVRAFLNDTYLYLLFEVAGEIGSYVQLDVEVTTAEHEEYMINARPYDSSSAHLSRVEGKRFIDLGEQGEVAQGAAFEMRVPLAAFEGQKPEALAVRVMDGTCCGPQWIAVDSTPPAKVLQTEETEPTLASLADLTAPDSAFCRDGALAQPEALRPAASIGVPSGFRADYFVPPSEFNRPSDVVVAPDGQGVVVSTARLLLRVGPDGSVSTYARLQAYALDLDAAGTLYAYFSPSGEIYQVRPNGSSNVIARVPQTACASALAVAPDGAIYIGLNRCGGGAPSSSSLLAIPPGGGEARLVTDLDIVQALDVAGGKLYATLGQSLVTVDTATGRTTPIARLPEWPSFHGLAVTEDGVAYVSTGDFAPSGHLYLVSSAGEVSTVASIEDNGLEGLALTPQGEVIGTQRAIGGLQAVDVGSGSMRTLIRPNGLTTPQALAISPCGELITVSDEAGGLTMATPDGHNRLFTPLISFTPPETFLAFSPAGWYVAGEAAPGLPSRLSRYLPNGLHETLAEDLPEVSGVAVGSDGSIYASSTTPDGRIVRILPDGERQVVADHLRTPQALALARDGTLYAVVGGESGGPGPVFATPSWGDTVISLQPDGTQALLAKIDHAGELAFGPDGLLYVAADQYIYRIWPLGVSERFAGGFSGTHGLAFDLAGNLYVGDNRSNDIVRISGFPTVRLTGTASDAATGAPLAGVRVRVVQAGPPFAGRMVATGADGAFSLPVSSGAYTVSAWAEGYQSAEADIVVGKSSQEVKLFLSPLER